MNCLQKQLRRWGYLLQRFYFLFIIISFSVSAHAAEDMVPAWLKDRPFKEGYLYGIGKVALQVSPHAATGSVTSTNDKNVNKSDVDSAQERSRDEAYADIAHQLLSSVANERSSEMEKNVSKEDGETKKALISRFSKKTSAKTALDNLPGLTIQEQVQDTKFVYTLAVLDIAAFADAAAVQIAETDALLTRLATQMDEPLTARRIQALRRILPRIEKRERFAMVLASQGEVIDATPLSSHDVRLQLGALVDDIKMHIAKAEQSPVFSDAVKLLLDDLGIVQVAVDEAVYICEINEEKRVRESGKWIRLHLRGKITVVDALTGSVLGGFELSAEKASTQGEDHALQRTREELMKKIEQEGLQKFIQIFQAQE